MAHGHGHEDEVRNSRESFRAAMTGFGVAVGWLLILSAAMIWLATPSGEGHGPEKGAPAAAEAGGH